MKYSYLFDTDSYKASHYLQYPPNTTEVYSYIESRGGDFDYNVFFGLQYFIKEYLLHRVTEEEVNKAEKFFLAHGLPFNKEGWMYIAKDLAGKLPVRIKAVPEGTIIPTHNILLSIESTDPKCFWIVSWLETMLLRAIWYPTTVCTLSHYAKQIIKKALDESADNTSSEIAFKLHDFGSRGVSSQESAMLGGAAHLVNFMGSDTVAGILCANDYYNCEMAGFSIPASEHSSITSWGPENEEKAYENMLNQFAKPGSIVACVSDSYNIYEACEKLWGEKLKQKIIDSKATLVIRPDSGDPKEVVLKVLNILGKKFGYTVNSKNKKVLNNVKVIQGDGVNLTSIKEILDEMLEYGWSASNIAFGMGGALLQKVNRDTNKFAMKCSFAIVDGKPVEVFKKPITDSGKNSKAGKLDLINYDPEVEFHMPHYSKELLTINIHDNKFNNKFKSELITYYENGEVLIDDNFENIRNRSNKLL